MNEKTPQQAVHVPESKIRRAIFFLGLVGMISVVPMFIIEYDRTDGVVGTVKMIAAGPFLFGSGFMAIYFGYQGSLPITMGDVLLFVAGALFVLSKNKKIAKMSEVFAVLWLLIGWLGLIAAFCLFNDI